MEQPDPQILLSLLTAEMPFGKYKGTKLADLPLPYLEWFHEQGFPKGKLGMQMATCFEIKSNGLDQILYDLKKMMQKGK